MIIRYSYILFIPLISILSLSFLAIPQVYAERGISVTERRIALVIGNSAYKSSPLRNPVNDATDMAEKLRRLGFQVSLGRDWSRKEMRTAVRIFGDDLKRGGIGLFYYAGHGMQAEGKNYLIPVGSDIAREDEIQDEAIDAGSVLRKMESAGNTMNMVFLDACRNNPFARSFRSTNKGLAQMDAPSGSLIVYATAPGSVAADGSGRNGIFTKNLLAYLEIPGLPVNQILMNVRKDVRLETDGKQVPWESSSLEGNFYFMPDGKASNILSPDSSISSLEAERLKLQEEQIGIEAEKRLMNERKRLAEERRKLEIEKEKMKTAILTQGIPEGSSGGMRSSDGRYVDHGDGAITDTKTGLIWTKEDSWNETSGCMDWNASKRWLKRLSTGGYTDWRLPTVKELKGIYEKSKENITGWEGWKIDLDPIFSKEGALWYWSSETVGSCCARVFTFYYGSVSELDQNFCGLTGVRAVRRASMFKRKQPVKIEEDDEDDEMF